MSGLCLTAGQLLLAIPVSGFTLVWTNPVDQVRWEQSWTVTARELRMQEGAKREEGSGLALDKALSMPGAGKRNVVIGTGPDAPRYELCLDGRCKPLLELMPGIAPGTLIELSPCP